MDSDQFDPKKGSAPPAWLPHEIAVQIIRMGGYSDIIEPSEWWQFEFEMLNEFFEANSDPMARASLNRMLEMGTRPFLYLRGFRLGAYTYPSHPDMWEKPDVPESTTVILQKDSLFQEQLSNIVGADKLLAIENPAEPIRNAHIPKLRFTDADWEAAATELIRIAKVIFIHFDNPSAGVFGELNLTRTLQAASRTIVVRRKPDALSGGALLRTTIRPVIDEFEDQCQEILREFPVQLDFDSPEFAANLKRAISEIELADDAGLTPPRITLPPPPRPVESEAAYHRAKATEMIGLVEKAIPGTQTQNVLNCLRYSLAYSFLADDTELRAECGFQLARWTAFCDRNLEGSLKYFEIAANLYSRLNLPLKQIHVVRALSTVLTFLKRADEARDVLKSAMDLALEVQDAWAQFTVWESLYSVETIMGEKTRAEGARTEAMRVYQNFRKAGNQPVRRPAFALSILLHRLVGSPREKLFETLTDPIDPIEANVYRSIPEKVVDGIGQLFSGEITAKELLARAQTFDEEWELFQLIHNVAAHARQS